jgi:hypothetical protein
MHLVIFKGLSFSGDDKRPKTTKKKKSSRHLAALELRDECARAQRWSSVANSSALLGCRQRGSSGYHRLTREL